MQPSLSVLPSSLLPSLLAMLRGHYSLLLVVRPVAIWAPYTYILFSLQLLFHRPRMHGKTTLVLTNESSPEVFGAWGTDAELCHPAGGSLPQHGPGQLQDEDDWCLWASPELSTLERFMGLLPVSESVPGLEIDGLCPYIRGRETNSE